MTTKEFPHIFTPESDINIKLMKLVKKYPFLYDAKDPRTKDRLLVNKSWSTISSETGLPVEAVKIKWHRLRGNFKKAIDRREKTPTSGSAATKLQRPWCYEADLDFLRPHMFCGQPTSSSSKQTSVESNPDSPLLGVSEGLEHDHQYESKLVTSSSELELGASISVGSAKKRTLNEPDPDVSPHINKYLVRDTEVDDPAIGWFKSLLPMYNSLTFLEKLEFQSNVALELRRIILNKEDSLHLNQHQTPRNRYKIIRS